MILSSQIPAFGIRSGSLPSFCGFLSRQGVIGDRQDVPVGQDLNVMVDEFLLVIIFEIPDHVAFPVVFPDPPGLAAGGKGGEILIPLQPHQVAVGQQVGVHGIQIGFPAMYYLSFLVNKEG